MKLMRILHLNGKCHLALKKNLIDLLFNTYYSFACFIFTNTLLAAAYLNKKGPVQYL